jgi:hypothetical protein
LLLALVLFSAVALVAMLLLHDLRMGPQLLRGERSWQRLDTIVEGNLHALANHYAAMFTAGAASALDWPDPAQPAAVQVTIQHTDGTWVAASSPVAGSTADRTWFASHAHGYRLPAGWIDSGNATRMAWAWEDLALLSEPVQRPPDWWPAPGWQQLPLNTHMDVPAHHPVIEPAPVLVHLTIRLGIFAAGPETSREKVVRMRFHIDGVIWNPYHRALTLHTGSGMRPMWQVSIHGLPAVRIENLTTGMRSSLLELDEVANDQTGEAGLQAYVRLPAQLDAGAAFRFSEPDPRTQPEGLARTLHHGFMAGAGDRIRLLPAEQVKAMHFELRQLPVNPATAPVLAVTTTPRQWPAISFTRADQSPRAFLLPDGSLSYRRHHAQWALQLGWSSLTAAGQLDPRHSSYQLSSPLPCAATGWRPAEEWWKVAVHDISSEESALAPPDPLQAPLQAWFSWPDPLPGCLLQAAGGSTEVPWFRLGAASATDLNAAWLNEPRLRLLVDGLRRGADDGPPLWLPVRHVNHPHPRQWWQWLTDGLHHGPEGNMRYPLYAGSDSGIAADWWEPSPEAIARAAEWLAANARRQPASSVGQWFDQGTLLHALDLHEAPPPEALLPLTGILRGGPAPVIHGPVAILHLAATDGQRTCYARAWLQQLPATPDGPLRHQIIHVERSRITATATPAEPLQIPLQSAPPPR